MRAWKQQIEKREDIDAERPLEAGDFKMTSEKHGEKEDLDAVIQSEFGEDYRLADWTEIKAFSESNPNWADLLGLVEGQENPVLVSNEGYTIWNGRQYFISRFNHEKVEPYLAHDEIDDDLVCLGSWFGISMPALAVKK